MFLKAPHEMSDRFYLAFAVRGVVSMDVNDVFLEVSGSVSEVLRVAKQLKDLNPAFTRKKRELLADKLEADVHQLQLVIEKARTGALELENSQIELRDKIERLKQWHEDKAGYEEYITSAGGVTYRRKRNDDEQSAGHHLCATCFENDKKSVLQRIPNDGAAVQFKCHQCGTLVMMEALRGFMDIHGPEWER